MAKKKKVEKPQREFTRRQLSHLQKQKRRQRFVFIGGVTVIAAVVLIVLIGWLIGEVLPLHKTVLKVNGTEFDTSYYIDVLKIAGASQPDSNLQAMAGSVIQQVTQDELVRQAAEKLGITVSDEEVKKRLKDLGAPVSDGYVGFFRGQLLQTRLKDRYFGAQVLESDEQVHAMAMLVESESQALETRNRLQSGDNFTALAEEFAQNYYSKNVNKGDFGWHPEVILKNQLGSVVALDYAFDAEVGALSEPLYDEEIYKQLGYWLIRVNDIPEEGSASVSAVFLSSEEEAMEIKARLEAGEELRPIADEYSDYSPSRDKHGELGTIMPEEISELFDAYVFSLGVELGKWSEPIRDDAYWTKGGYWLVEVVDKDDDRKLSSEDRTTLIQQLFDDWLNRVWGDPENDVDNSYLTEELGQWAIDRALKDMQEAEG
ncbi:MAG: peptidylprolyl isomerase [Dehalococcoidales bacterium]|nr:peptidylprolyl isomerase [Dehalococcoidales bacterium]